LLSQHLLLVFADIISGPVCLPGRTLGRAHNDCGARAARKGDSHVSDRIVGIALTLAFLCLLIIIVAVGYLGMGAIEDLHAEAQNIAHTEWRDVQLANEALETSNQNSRIVIEVVMINDVSRNVSLLAERAKNDTRVFALLKQLQSRAGSTKEQELLNSVINSRGAYYASSHYVTDVLLQKDPIAARHALTQTTFPLLARYHVAWSEFIQFQANEMNERLERANRTYAASRKRTIFLISLGVLLSLGITVVELKKTFSEMRRRSKLESNMRQLNQDLELRVLHRTAALDQSNKELLREIACREKTEEQLFEQTVFLEAQANCTIDGILVVDENNRKRLQNHRFVELFGLPSSIAESDDDKLALEWVLAQISEPETFIQRVKYLYEHRQDTSRDEIRLKNGTVLDRYSSPVTGKDGKYYGRIWIFRDITDRKLAEERVQFLAYYDALTKLPNRALLQDRLSKALAAARRRRNKVGLLFLDLDRFKIINDSLGHSVGDLLLQEVGERLKRLARDQDTVSRVGGDEFVHVLTSIEDITDAAVVAERIVGSIRDEFLIQGHVLSIGCSIGISIFPEHGTDAETLIKNADAAMYSAKDSGRGNFRFFTEDMNAQVVERLTVENNLRLALERQELFLEYQPQIDIHREQITGLEALIRWRHPKLGLIPPDKFIRVAENCGLILPMGEWVLKTACIQARKWQDEGLLAVPAAVNVSAVQFRQENFPDFIQNVLRETALDPQYLELELTESALLTNKDVTFSVLERLKGMGLKLAVDDFGIGYSSLSYLKTFPVSKLKIDRSFVNDIGVHADDEAIALAIISMAKSLNLKVVAEGVETERQMAFLRKHDCDQIQGYYFSKPISPDQLTAMVRGIKLTDLKEDSASRPTAEQLSHKVFYSGA